MRAIREALTALSFFSAMACAAAEPIELYYNERPPYLVTSPDGRGVSGLTGTPAARAFERAGIAHTWVQMPTSRQIATLKQNERPACAVGWFRNEERERFARYTRPIYRDRPTVALAHAGFDTKHQRLDGVFSHSPGTKVLVKAGFSYGPYIDALLARWSQAALTTNAENTEMVRMVSMHRGDFMFAAEEEADYLVEKAGVPRERVRLIRFSDMPEGESRHIICSMKVPASLIERLDIAIGAAK